MPTNLLNEFKNPSNAYRGKPFWSWNGKLEKDEILRQVHVMKDMGLGGYFMHSRTGLETEYLGEEWFDLINACTDEGEKLGLESWLYDEDRWPSGSAGGMVTKNPDYRMKFMYMDKQDGNLFEWTDKILAAFVADYDGLILNSYKRIMPNTPKEVYQSEKLLVFTWREMDKSTFYNGYTYLDTLSEEATEAYIKSTHEKYKEKCGERLQKSIKGIFTDEPHRGQMMSTFGSEKSQGDKKNYAVSWTPKLFELFEERFGYDVSEKLPELFLWHKGEKVSAVKWHYVEMVQQLFIDHFAKPINQWCRDNDLIFTGHILHENSLSNQTAMSGSMMRFYEYMEYPGIDVLSEHCTDYWIVKQLSSVARQLGQKWMLSELYGCTGWQFSFEGHKFVGDWQALFGINLRCHHLSWYTMKGEAKRDYPASILHQSTWWEEYKYVEDYFSRINVIMTTGEPICSTLVLNPVESVWSQVYPGWCNGLEAADEDIKKLEEQYSNLFRWLCSAHIDFDYGDEDIISHHFKIEKDVDGQPLLCIGEAKYRQVIVGGMTTMRSTTVTILNKFIEASGTVIFAGDVPKYVDAIKSDQVQLVAKNALCVAFNEQVIAEVAAEKSDKIIDIKNVDGTINTDIYLQSRQDKDRQYIMILNTNRDQGYENVKITFKTEGYIEEWSSISGQRYNIGECNNGLYEYITDMNPGESRIFIVVKQEDHTLERKIEYKNIKQSITTIEEYDYTLSEQNVCVLDIASYNINNQGWQESDEILKVDRKVRDYFGLPYRSGDMLQPWFVKKKGFEDKGTIKLAYDFNVDNIPEGDLYLVIEAPEQFNIKINGHEVNVLLHDDYWIDICFKKIKLDNHLHIIKGKNTVELEGKFNERTDLEAIYIVGEFGVSLKGHERTIGLLPEKITIGDITKQGLPFYSGKITYNMDVEFQPKEDDKVFMKFNDFEGACIKVKGEDGKEEMVAWQPYEADITEGLKKGSKLEIEVVLTRRNTFGPLHLVPKRAMAYGPGHFTTEGEAFTRDYALIETGLLEKPIICVKGKKNYE